MKTYSRISAALLAALMLVTMLPFAAFSADETQLLTQFEAMTYNIKNESLASARLTAIQNQNSDIIGFQEVISGAYTSLSSGLSGYTGIQGSARGTSLFQANEYNPIFYKSSVFEKLDSGTFWLSDTPSSQSKFSDSEYYRICTWGFFRVKNSSPEQYLLFMNTHLDYGPEVDGKYTYVATAKQAQVLLTQMVSLETSLSSTYSVTGEDVMATMITGDFNVTPSHAVVKYMTGTGNAVINSVSTANTITGTRLARTYSMTSNRTKNADGLWGTVYSSGTGKYSNELDHILATTRTLACTQYVVDSTYDSGDHLPVVSAMQFRQPVDSAKLSLLNVDEADSSFAFYTDGSSTPQAYTSLNCAPTSLNVNAMVKFMVDSTQTGSLAAYIDKMEIFNGPQSAAAFAPYDFELESSSSSGTASYTEPNTPVYYAGFTSGATSNSKLTHSWGTGTVSGTTVNTGTRTATYSDGAVRLLNSTTVSGYSSGTTPSYINSSYNATSTTNTTSSWGSGTNGATLDMVLKFENLPRYTGSSLPTTTSSATPIGQVGLIIDMPMRGFLSTSIATDSNSGNGKYTREFYLGFITYYNSTLGGNEVVITCLTGNRNSINTSGVEYIHTGILESEMDAYHRYTFVYNPASSAQNQRLTVYVDGVAKGTCTDIMYRGTAIAYESVWMTASNRGITDSSTWVDAYLDSYALYNNQLTPPSNLADFSEMYTTLSKAQASDYTPNSYAAVAPALAALKEDTYSISVLNDASGYPVSYLSTRVTDRIADLQAAYDGLEPMSASVDFTDLLAAVAAAEALKEPMYTEDSWATLQGYLDQVDYTVTNQSTVDTLAANINSAISALVTNDLIWYEDFTGATSLPSTMATVSGYTSSNGMTIGGGYLQYNLAIPSSSYFGDAKALAGVSQFGDENGVTINLYACLDSLPTLSTSAKAPFRGVQVDLYLAGVDKMLTVGLNAMTAAEKSANPGCDAWVSLFNVQRSGAVVNLPVYLGIGDGKVHKYTFVYDVNQVRDLSGNVFGIYTDSACTQLVDTINVSGSITSSNDLPIYNTPTNTSSGVRTYYIKQIEAAPGYLMSKTVITYAMSADVADTTVYLNNAALSDQPIYALKGAPTYGEAYTGTYDGAAHNAITSVVNNMPDRITITYSTDGVSYSAQMPTVQEPGTVTVYAKATDTQGVYQDLITTFETSIDYILSLALSGNTTGDSVTVSNSNATLATVSSAETSYVPGLSYGNTITLTAEGEGFLFWKNARNDRQISTETSLTYPIGSQMDLVAVYNTADGATSYTVVFKDSQTGKIYGTSAVASGAALATGNLPDVIPALYGYDFLGWMTEDYRDAVGTVVSADLTIYAKYTRLTPVDRTLTVVDGSSQTQYTRPFAKTVAVTASSAGFSYWKLGEKILTTQSTVVFGMPDEDVTLTAVYGASDTPTDPIVTVVSGAVNASDSFAVIFARDIPDGVEFVESGILMTRKADPSELYIGTTNSVVTKGVSTAAKSDTCYGFQKNMTDKSGTWYFRGYMAYKNASGQLCYLYSDTYQLSVSSGTAAFATLYNS